MAPTLRTPGVFITETEGFGGSIVGVSTAVPCFIGYTGQARDDHGRDCLLVPQKLGSQADYEMTFGGACPRSFYLADVGAQAVAATDRICGTVSIDGAHQYQLVEAGDGRFNLHDAIRLFYDNGGGECWVVSCGDYGGRPTPAALLQGLAVGAALVGPSMVAIPDAMLLAEAEAAEVVAAMLAACAGTQDRMALLDVWGTEDADPHDWAPVVARFREGLQAAAPDALQFGAAYFPPLATSLTSASDIDLTSFATDPGRIAGFKAAFVQAIETFYPPRGDEAGPIAADANGVALYRAFVEPLGGGAALDPKQWAQALGAALPGFGRLTTAIAAILNPSPASGAIAGVWATNDTVRGVWNAPANLAIASAIAPVLPIGDDQQSNLNTPADGLAVNAIRAFAGQGLLVWGARTLDGNSNDWRYIPVRRTIIYIEQSVKLALAAFAFQPNAAPTWASVAAAIESFLHQLWAAGGLVGSNPADAYQVQVGLGSTMTSEDVLNGIMRVQIMVAVAHPAEFIAISVEQQMQG